jgi:GDP-4-dehydro-6-deoxy-D-mannose reductase
MRALITGAKGFVGSHLIEFLLTKNFEVFGFDRRMATDENIRQIPRDKFKVIEGDMSDYNSVREAIKLSKPDQIYHLAAQSYVPASWNQPAETLTNNIIGEVNIFEACRELGLKPKIQIACSSEEYGLVKPEETPIKETNELRPQSPYAVSKIAQDYLGRQYFASYGIPVVITRAFNHTGPRRGEVFVTSNFAKQIAEIEKNAFKTQKLKIWNKINVGNLEAKRDFTDVRDMVRAYWMALEFADPGEVYNICSGVAISIREVLETLLSFSKIKVATLEDPTRMRPSDVPLLLGDSSKFRNKTGWKPEISFGTTMSDLLEYWRVKVKNA